MRILVTGASGLLGSAVVKALNQSGYQIRILTRRESDLQAIADFEVERSFGDITQYDSVAEAVKGCQVLVHTAALTKQTGVSVDEYNRVNVDGTLNLLRAAMQNGNPRIIYVSTASTIKFGDKKNPGTELSNAEQDFGSGYIKSKILAEQEVQRAVRFDGVKAVIVNPTFMIGPFNNKTSSGELLHFASSHKNLPSPPGGKNFVDVNDVATCITRSLTLGRPGERYLIANENLSYSEFFRLVEGAQGAEKRVFEIPSFLWATAQKLLNTYQKVTHSSAKINSTMMKISAAKTYYTGEKAKREFGILYTPINKTLKKFFAS